MKKMTLITLALAVLVAISMTGEANAGWFDRDEKVEADSEPHRFELLPSMEFFRGTIRRDAYSGWLLDECSLQLMGNGTVTMEGSDEGHLQEGQSAVVMGVKFGSTLVAYRIKVMKPDYGYNSQKDSNVHVEPGPNPNVGVGTGPM